MVPLARLPGAAPGGAVLRVAPNDRLRDARRVWRMARGPRLWRGLVPEFGAGRLGALPLRLLELDRALGVELDRRRAVGLRAVPLRPLGLYRPRLRLASGPLRARPRLCPGPRPLYLCPRVHRVRPRLP